MAIKAEYFDYLEHMGKTVTVNEFALNCEETNLIALRHDVDRDLNTALEMAFWEKERGYRSTFYLLHTASYWQDPRFIDRVLQIQDFGHEIGLHNSILSEWVRGNVDNICGELKSTLDRLRESGIRISGTSTHGDPFCYKKQFINYWCFADLAPDDPAQAESGLSAEGIPAENETYHIMYPPDHRLTRDDGGHFPLWSIPMNELGLSYEAIHTSFEGYYTDSHGEWLRSEDPLHVNLNRGRHQILMHPEHWRGSQRIYFFLSAARSGSKWLANFLNKATPIRAVHEFTLNHRFREGKLIPEKRTGHGFADLVNEKREVRSLLIESRNWIQTLNQDFAEANVYLEGFLPLMNEIFPEAVPIYLHRDPKDVVRSLMNRRWYDTPKDDKHPVMEVEGWRRLDQFEKACWYVRLTNESLLNLCEHAIVFERMVQDIEYLTNTLVCLGVPVFPRLGTEAFREIINASACKEFPVYSAWNEEQCSTFHGIMWPVIMELGYEVNYGGDSYEGDLGTLLKKYIEKRRAARKRRWRERQGENQSENLANIGFEHCKPEQFFSVGCRINISENGLVIIPRGKRHAFCIIGGGTWYRIEEGHGWPTRIGSYLRGRLRASCEGRGFFTLFCLMFDETGEQIDKRPLGIIRQNDDKLDFSCRPMSEAIRFSLAVYMDIESLPQRVELQHLTVESVQG